jgi:5'-nucleotidase
LGNVFVVAPDKPQSGMGHAITIHEPLKIRKSYIFDALGVESFECSGTPADCVKIAKNHILSVKPDLVVSGINHGSNTSVNILYSGTMSAAVEAAVEDLPAIGFSLCDYSPDADFSHTEDFILKICRQVLRTGLPKGTALNVNIPKKGHNPVRGIRICRQAKAKWQEKFDERTDPYGRKYFWLAGDFIEYDHGEDTDEWAVRNNYVSVVPCTYDLTAHYLLPILNQEWDII